MLTRYIFLISLFLISCGQLFRYGQTRPQEYSITPTSEDRIMNELPKPSRTGASVVSIYPKEIAGGQDGLMQLRYRPDSMTGKCCIFSNEFIRFDLSQIPTQANIISAKLRLRRAQYKAEPFSIAFRILNLEHGLNILNE